MNCENCGGTLVPAGGDFCITFITRHERTETCLAIIKQRERDRCAAIIKYWIEDRPGEPDATLRYVLQDIESGAVKTAAHLRGGR